MSKPCDGVIMVPTKGSELLVKTPHRYTPPFERSKTPILTVGDASWSQIRARIFRDKSSEKH